MGRRSSKKGTAIPESEFVPLLSRIQDQIINCERCPRLVQHRRRVAEEKVRRFQNEFYWGRPVPSLGDPQARLLIIGLAPAAHGANRTGRAFTGDRSGEWLFEALHSYGFANLPRSSHRLDGLILHDCFITQVIHCAPPGNKPAREEIANCRPYFLAELQQLKRVELVVPLGRLAFDAYLRACLQLGNPLPSPRPRFEHGKSTRLPTGHMLLPSYHPSQQNTQTGRLTRSMFHQVFATARTLLDEAQGGRAGIYR